MPEVGAAQLNSNNDRLWSTLAHLSGLFTHFLGPLIIWLVKKNDSPFVDDQGKEALNFQLSILVYQIISGVFLLIVIGLVLFLALYIFEIIVVIKAAVSANHGEKYRYPMTIRFVK
jgi:uncharacterized Tic20 family protein